MSKTFDQGREEIARLCRYFADNRQAFLAAGVKEAHIRQSLIDPFFEALGWDLRNAAMTAPQYREVITEDSLEIEGQQKAPDYAFRVGTLSKFYTEAKKCGININADPGPAYQLRRYGWSAKVPLSILTDFEELGVYDCSLRPKPADKASFARIQYYKSEQYADCWRELWDIFSREAVWAGAYDRYAASKRKRGTSEVDNEFLKEIESWRDDLARNIALRNQFLSPDDLNAAVQRTIDRIIFLRMAEDRGSESYGQLLKLCDQPNIYLKFISKLCKSADEKYNSGLFHFNKEDGTSESLDSITPRLQVDDKVFKPILQSLYFEHGSPYHFGVLPVEILGTVYERFLGKVIRLTPEHRAKVEEKPEVRKAGGVYYTPAYIVDYIVKNTVGKMIEGRSPAQLAGGKSGQPLRVLDMACGSGSFLLGAFKCLLDHCLKWYMEHQPEKFKNEIFKNRRDEWQLTIAEKKRILITHIFGVDIDAQAVEVSKLSLLLKVMEGETDETVGKSRQLFHERALPNLSNNIKCGNSLIGPDYFSGRLIPDPDEMKRVNPFDWNREFPEAMKSGGFDCVIGNPPYVRQESLGDDFKSYVKEKYNSYAGTADLYIYFIEQSLKLLIENGNFGFICSNKWMRSNYGRPLRELIKNESKIEQIIDFGELPVFQGAATFPTILLLKKEKSKKHNFIFAPIKHLDFTSLSDEVSKIGEKLNEHSIKGENWTLASSREVELFEKMRQVGVPLGEYINGKIYYGIKTGLNDAFVIDRETRDRLISEDKKSAELIKPFLCGDDVRKYFIHFRGQYIIKIPKGWTRQNIGTVRDPWNWFQKSYPAVARHLEPFAIKAQKRQDKGDYWWELRTCDYYEDFEKPKIVYPVIAMESRFAFDTAGFYSNDKTFFINTDNLYLLAILNSNLAWVFLKRLCSVLGDPDRRGRLELRSIHVSQLPIKKVDCLIAFEKATKKRIVSLVQLIIDLIKKVYSNRNEREVELFNRQIKATNSEIDKLVYRLYGLTDDEIKLVEDGVAK